MNKDDDVVDLNTLMNIQERIYSSIGDEINNANRHKFGINFFENYRRDKQLFLDAAVHHLIANHKDFRGNLIFSIDDINVDLTNDENNFPRVFFGPNVAYIQIPARYCYVLDLFVLCFNYRESGNSVDKLEFSMYLQVILENYDSSLGQFISNQLGSIKSSSAWQKDLTIYTSVLASLSVLYHEIGHFASGHVSYYFQTPPQSYSFREKTSLFHSESLGLYSQDEAVKLWIAEITSDTYAFIRLFLFSQSDGLSSKISKAAPYIFKSFIPALEASIIPILLSRYFLNNRPRHKDGRLSSHPPYAVREMNLCFALHFCLSPLPQQWSDVRKTELENTPYAKQADLDRVKGSDHFRDHTVSVDWAFIQALSEMRTNLGPLLQWHGSYNIGTLLLNAKLAKRGMYPPYTEELEYLMHPQGLLLHEIWQSLSNGQALQFSRGMHPNSGIRCNDYKPQELYNIAGHDKDTQLLIIKRLQSMYVIRDPVFKIIDDWMSNIARFGPTGTKEDQETRENLVQFELANAKLMGRQSLEFDLG